MQSNRTDDSEAMGGEHMSNTNTRGKTRSGKSISFRITDAEYEALKIATAIQGTNAITASARNATLDVIKATVPTNTLTRLGL